jgi:hypothetical protein
VWTLLAFLTQIGTCKIDSRPKNGFLYTKNVDFKRISEGTNCSLDAQSSQGCKLWLIDLKCMKRNVQFLSNSSGTFWRQQSKFLYRLKAGVKNNRRKYVKMWHIKTNTI